MSSEDVRLPRTASATPSRGLSSASSSRPSSFLGRLVEQTGDTTVRNIPRHDLSTADTTIRNISQRDLPTTGTDDPEGAIFGLDQDETDNEETDGTDEEDDAVSIIDVDAIVSEDDEPPESWIDADPFLEKYGLALLQPLRLLLCVQCLYCVPSGDIVSHRKDKHSDHLLREKGLDEFIAWCEKARSPPDLTSVMDNHPTDSVPPYPLLTVVPGFSCPVQGCRRLGTARDKIAKHIKVRHPASTTATPEPAFFQSLFSQHRGGYVRVTGPHPTVPTPIGSRPSDIWMAKMQEHQALYDPPIIQDNQPQRSHPFLMASGWSRPLKDKTYREMELMHTTLEPSPTLNGVMKKFVKRIQDLFTPASYDGRCLINTERSDFRATLRP